jgi:hypothetical protein
LRMVSSIATKLKSSCEFALAACASFSFTSSFTSELPVCAEMFLFPSMRRTFLRQDSIPRSVIKIVESLSFAQVGRSIFN